MKTFASLVVLFALPLFALAEGLTIPQRIEPEAPLIPVTIAPGCSCPLTGDCTCGPSCDCGPLKAKMGGDLVAFHRHKKGGGGASASESVQTASYSPPAPVASTGTIPEYLTFQKVNYQRMADGSQAVYPIPVVRYTPTTPEQSTGYPDTFVANGVTYYRLGSAAAQSVGLTSPVQSAPVAFPAFQGGFTGPSFAGGSCGAGGCSGGSCSTSGGFFRGRR